MFIFQVTLDSNLGQLSCILDLDHYAVVVHSQRLCKYNMHAFIN